MTAAQGPGNDASSFTDLATAFAELFGPPSAAAFSALRTKASEVLDVLTTPIHAKKEEKVREKEKEQKKAKKKKKKKKYDASSDSEEDYDRYPPGTVIDYCNLCDSDDKIPYDGFPCPYCQGVPISDVVKKELEKEKETRENRVRGLAAHPDRVITEQDDIDALWYSGDADDEPPLPFPRYDVADPMYDDPELPPLDRESLFNDLWD